MFGQRVEGVGLTPGRSSTFSQGGIVRGPGGDFLGRGAYGSGMRFPGQPWQFPTATYQSYPEFLGLVPYPPDQIPPALNLPAPTPPIPPTPNEPMRTGQPPAAEAQPQPGPEQPMRQVVEPQSGISPAAAGSEVASAVTVRIPVQTGFRTPQLGDHPAVAVTQLIQRLSEIKKTTPVTVVMQGDTAVLRGEVASEHDRALAESIALLEPGIWDVRNELLIGSRSSAVSRNP